MLKIARSGISLCELPASCGKGLLEPYVMMTLQGKGVSGQMAEAASAEGSAGSAQAKLTRCLSDYNPQEREEYEEVVATWLASMLLLADHLAQHPAASSAESQAEQDQLPLPPTPPSKQDLAA